jgi:hypothetical protein
MYRYGLELFTFYYVWKVVGIVNFEFDCSLSTILKPYLLLLCLDKFIINFIFVFIEVLYIIKESIYELRDKTGPLKRILCDNPWFVHRGPVTTDYT